MIKMEDKKISEKESLELIARMIKETQDHLARHTAYPMLIWGYTTIFVALVVWMGLRMTGDPRIHFVWFLLVIIGLPLTYYFKRKEKKEGIKNYMDRITTQTWIVFGLVAWTLSCLSFFVPLNILFVISLLMGMGTILTGCIIKYRPFVIGGIVGTLLSLSLLFIRGTDQILIFACIFLVMMVIPGHLLNSQVKKLC